MINIIIILYQIIFKDPGAWVYGCEWLWIWYNSWNYFDTLGYWHNAF